MTPCEPVTLAVAVAAVLTGRSNTTSSSSSAGATTRPPGGTLTDVVYVNPLPGNRNLDKVGSCMKHKAARRGISMRIVGPPGGNVDVQAMQNMLPQAVASKAGAIVTWSSARAPRSIRCSRRPGPREASSRSCSAGLRPSTRTSTSGSARRTPRGCTSPRWQNDRVISPSRASGMLTAIKAKDRVGKTTLGNIDQGLIGAVRLSDLCHGGRRVIDKFLAPCAGRPSRPHDSNDARMVSGQQFGRLLVQGRV